ncbi:Glycosyl transferase family 2 [Lachnospiraceae bacterium XPB1003]|nr:Glycosyl transferase family 2 [Lachnospiraceae bacterium XPB1003]
MNRIAIIIPAYEPDKRLISLIDDLVQKEIGPIFVVNDGSDMSFDCIFNAIKDKVENSGGLILKHEVNKGKGRALKTAFGYILDNVKNVQAVVTADSDGQHTSECIQHVIDASLYSQWGRFSLT